jgi:phage replication-related protein YjqB (UPF0714/DUF867 family)
VSGKLPTTFWEFMGFLVEYGPQAVIGAMVAWGLYQNKQQLKNQEEMKVQLDGVTTDRVDQASIAGRDAGKIQGAAQEQAREASRVAAASDAAFKIQELKSHDDAPVYSADPKIVRCSRCGRQLDVMAGHGGERKVLECPKCGAMSTVNQPARDE